MVLANRLCDRHVGYTGDETMTERVCGDCSLCCKLPRIDDLGKPADTWCQWCKPGRGGCTVYADRPDVCKVFQCEWLKGDVEAAWKPLDSKMVIHLSSGGDKFTFLNIMVDLGFPNRWREPIWMKRIRQIAAVGHDHRIIVRVQCGRRSWIILPHQDEIEVPPDAKAIDITENQYGVRRIKFKGAANDAETI